MPDVTSAPGPLEPTAVSASQKEETIPEVSVAPINETLENKAVVKEAQPVSPVSSDNNENTSEISNTPVSAENENTEVLSSSEKEVSPVSSKQPVDNSAIPNNPVTSASVSSVTPPNINAVATPENAPVSADPAGQSNNVKPEEKNKDAETLDVWTN